jgi:hypothetical protein
VFAQQATGAGADNSAISEIMRNIQQHKQKTQQQPPADRPDTAL